MIRRKQGNRYDDIVYQDKNGNYRIGYCHNTNTPFLFDAEVFDLIKEYTWSEKVDRHGYHMLRAWDSETRKMIYFHWILGYKNGDHIDRNPLNNRKYNLRKATGSENAINKEKTYRNKSGIIGVCWDDNQKRWRAYISINKCQKHLGWFNNKNDAIECRLKAEKKYYGEFSPQQNLFEQYGIT